mmetsp:Transcript_3059/g.5791  ORF Transcript_3059/g.5791 Transcript_3059/m.5791 type:complete len:317 (-) Transcript_3059:1164-2114(-)
MVLNQVLARNTQVKRVPELELLLHLGQLVGGDGAVSWGWLAEEHVVEHRVRHMLRLDGVLAVPENVALLQDVRDGVVRHVDGGVREGLHQELRVPRQARAQPKGAAQRPLLEPAHGDVELAQVLVRVELHLGEALLRLGQPLLLPVHQVPLVRQRHHALLARARHHFLLGLAVQARAPVRAELVLEQRLGHLHRLALVFPDEHHSLIEALHVGAVLGLVQLDAVVLALNLHLLAHRHRGRVPELRDVDDGNHLKRHHPLVLDPELFAHGGLLLEVLQRHVVVRGVGGDTGHDSGALGHQDGEHGQAVDHFVKRQRG